MEDYKKLKADYDRISAAAQQKIIAEHVATRDDEIARLNLRVAQLTSGSEAANLAGRVVEQDAEIARLKAEVETAKAWQGAAVLRNHDMAHILIEEIGAPGPENVDETARRAVMLIVRLRRALAAGPAALRSDWVQCSSETAACTVEAAQAAAMKDDAKEGG